MPGEKKLPEISTGTEEGKEGWRAGGKGRRKEGERRGRKRRRGKGRRGEGRGGEGRGGEERGEEGMTGDIVQLKMERVGKEKRRKARKKERKYRHLRESV